MDFIPEHIEEYAEANSSPQSEILKNLERETREKILMPRMLSGHLQGALISAISKMINPNYILEIGTFTGYSALCLADGLTTNGELHTIEINDELESIIRKYFNQSPKKNQLHLHIGNALTIIPTLNKPFNLVFIDANKTAYTAYLELLIPTLPIGAWILADNVLWSGKVTNPKAKDPDTIALQEFSKTVVNHPQLNALMLPIRDGILLIQKIK
jgi:caffeoyl-CoA O-methyltransferase